MREREDRGGEPGRWRQWSRSMVRTGLLVVMSGGLLVGGAEAGGRPGGALPVIAGSSSGHLPAVQRTIIADPAAFERRILAAVERASAVTVGIRVGSRSGSGVLVSPDGLILTAAHLLVSPGRRARVTLPDGSEHEGRTLGLNPTRDSGMVRLLDARDLPCLDLPAEDDIGPGDWCLVVAHPGGVERGRPPVPRIGRILDPSRRAGDSSVRFIQTDCAIVGGDSGGGLFDLDGRLIGINSRIEMDVASNFHVPISTYRRHWDRLLAGEEWTRGRARLGLLGIVDARRGARIVDLVTGRPAARAGLRPGDVITGIEGDPVRDTRDLRVLLADYRPGERIEVRLRRGDKSLSLRVELAGPAGESRAGPGEAASPDRGDGDPGQEDSR